MLPMKMNDTCRERRKKKSLEKRLEKKNYMETSNFTVHPYPNNILCQTHLHTNNPSFFFY